MTVFVVNKTNDDLSAALQYGELRYINEHYITADRVENRELPAAWRDAMLAAADEFEPDEDYVLIVGDHLQLITFCSYLAQYFTDYTVLRYDRQAKGYYPVRIEQVPILSTI